MTANYLTALDDIFSQVDQTWNAISLSMLGYAGEIRWFGKEPKVLPDKSKYWLRVTQHTVLEKQSALGNVQEGNKRLYFSEGLLYLQLFCPIQDKSSVTKGRQLAEVLKNHFRNLMTTNGVLFHAARIDELPTDLEWYRFNIIADYNYEEIG